MNAQLLHLCPQGPPETTAKKVPCSCFNIILIFLLNFVGLIFCLNKEYSYVWFYISLTNLNQKLNLIFWFVVKDTLSHDKMLKVGGVQHFQPLSGSSEVKVSSKVSD